MYIGPFLVTKVLPPCNYVIQRSQRSKAQVVHQDKLKACLGETPKSWLDGTIDTGGSGVDPTAEAEKEDEIVPTWLTEDVEEDPTPASGGSAEDLTPGSPSVGHDEVLGGSRAFRNRERLKKPARYND